MYEKHLADNPCGALPYGFTVLSRSITSHEVYVTCPDGYGFEDDRGENILQCNRIEGTWSIQDDIKCVCK